MPSDIWTMDQVLDGLADIRGLLANGIHSDKEEAARQAIIKLHACPEYPLGMDDYLPKEKVLARDGAPVWVHVIDHSNFADPKDDFDGWGLVRATIVRVWDASRGDMVHVDYHMESYGIEWVAFDHKPI